MLYLEETILPTQYLLPLSFPAKATHVLAVGALAAVRGQTTVTHAASNGDGVNSEKSPSTVDRHENVPDLFFLWPPFFLSSSPWGLLGEASAIWSLKKLSKTNLKKSSCYLDSALK